MERNKQWKITLWMQYLVLVLAIVLLSIYICDYCTTKQVNWFYVGLGIAMIFNSVFSIRTAKREIRKEE